MNTPRYSIIIPVYKVEENIPHLMRCLQQQTDPDFEAIFVNDCSPDNAAAVIASYALHDSRIRLFHQPRNMRQGAARNRGLSEARGEFILFVDADDGFAPNYLERMHQALQKHNADMVLCNPVYEFETHSYVDDSLVKTPELQERVFSRDELLTAAVHHWGVGDFFYRVEPWAKMIRHSLLRHYGLVFPENMTSEDVAFSFCCACITQKTVAIRDALYFYNRRGESDLTRNALQYTKNFHKHHYVIKEFMEQHLPKEKADLLFSKFALLSFFPGIISFFSQFGNSNDEREYKRIAIESCHSFIENVDLRFWDRKFVLGTLKYIKDVYLSSDYRECFEHLILKNKDKIYNCIRSERNI